MKPLNVISKHLQGLNTRGEAMEYLRQFSVKQLKEIVIGLKLNPPNLSNLSKEKIINCIVSEYFKCTCGSRLTSCICK